MTCQLPTPEALMMDTWLLEYNKDALASARLPSGMFGRGRQCRLSGEQLFDQVSSVRLPV